MLCPGKWRRTFFTILWHLIDKTTTHENNQGRLGRSSWVRVSKWRIKNEKCLSVCSWLYFISRQHSLVISMKFNHDVKWNLSPLLNIIQMYWLILLRKKSWIRETVNLMSLFVSFSLSIFKSFGGSARLYLPHAHLFISRCLPVV